MSDLISRQAAINGADEIIQRDRSGNNDVVKAMTAWKEWVKALPSAEPVRHGKWIKADSQQYFRKHYPCFTCSECGYRKDSQKKWNYCPNCGADMRGEKDG